MHEKEPITYSYGESKDGTGAADKDKPFSFGRHLSVIDHCPFTEREFARLLILRGKIHDAIADGKHPAIAGWPKFCDFLYAI